MAKQDAQEDAQEEAGAKAQGGTPTSKFKVWLTAVRPFAYSASVSAVAMGLALAIFEGRTIDWILFFLTLLGVVCLHTAANLLNDVYDHRKGLDVTVLPVSGAIVRGWLTEKQVMRAAIGFLAVGVLCGLYLFLDLGLVVLVLGVIGTGLVLFYTRSGFCLKYIGLGDLTIFINFGILPVFGTYWVQTQTFSLLPIVWSIPIVLFTVGILHANNWHDIRSDTKKECITIASTLGEERSSTYYKFLMLGPFFLVLLYVFIGLIPQSPALVPPPLLAMIVLLALPAALKLATINKDKDVATFMMLDGKTAALQTLFAILLIAGLIASTLVNRIV